jgi:ribosomal protein S18 acetylase RimI-like enzyme
MDHVIIRRVEVQDLADCFHVESACYSSEGATRERIRKRIALFPEGFLVALIEDHIIGMINSGSTNRDDITEEAFKDMVGHEKDGGNIVIFSLAVLPRFQGLGISRKLMSTFLDVARALKKKKILLLCKTDLIPYYQHFGFSYGGPSRSEHGGFAWHEMFLALDTTEDD